IAGAVAARARQLHESADGLARRRVEGRDVEDWRPALATRYSRLAARVARGLRSPWVRRMWPNSDPPRPPPRAATRTDMALLWADRNGASIWLVSPVNTTLVPSAALVSTVLARLGSRFWASSSRIHTPWSDRPRRWVTDSMLRRPSAVIWAMISSAAPLRRPSLMATTASWMAPIQGSSFSSRVPGR